MLEYLLLGAFAVIFYRIGENEYSGKGPMLATISVALSFAGSVTGFSILAMFAANALLYLVCLGYNLLSNKPPTSGF